LSLHEHISLKHRDSETIQVLGYITE